jgi:nitroreductase
MEFESVARRRRMVRAYDPARAVSRETIDRLIGLGTHAPSAGFSQGWHFLVLDDPATCAEFWSATTTGAPSNAWLDPMRTAPALIVTLSDKQAYLDRYAEPDKGFTDKSESHWPVPYWDVDTGMAAMLMLLGVADAGLAACFFGVPRRSTEAASRSAPSRPTAGTAHAAASLFSRIDPGGWPAPVPSWRRSARGHRQMRIRR